jgi:hypothetical protein
VRTVKGEHYLVVVLGCPLCWALQRYDDHLVSAESRAVPPQQVMPFCSLLHARRRLVSGPACFWMAGKAVHEAKPD